jgi:PAS domain-containing protein
MHTNNDPHFRNLVDNALTGIIDNTLEGKILFVNQALARMFEFESPQQMQAEGTLLRWCDPERRKAFISRLKQQGLGCCGKDGPLRLWGWSLYGLL